MRAATSSRNATFWPDTAVSEGSLTRVVSLARAALAGRRAGPEIIRTHPRRGYQIAGHR